MMAVFFNFLRRYKTMILLSLFSFYSGCWITLSFLRIDCVNAILNNSTPNSIIKSEYAVLLLSGPNNEVKRDAIRATWMKIASNIFIENGEKLYKWNNTWTKHQNRQQLIKFYFVIGTKGLSESKITKLINEDRRSNDLLLLDNLEDTYENLASKMVKSLKWLNENLKELKYVIKSDDDSFVRVDLIVRDLEAYAPEMNAPEISEFVSYKKTLPLYKGLYWGYFNGKARVYLSGKWQEKDWFLCDNYLPYALGGGYVISRSIVDYISKNSEFLSHYNSEDVSMGVWTAPLDSINRVHDIRFDTEWKSRGCSKNMLVRHKQTPSDMFQLYNTLVQSQGERLCKIESTERKSYLYNWNVLPSVCCK